MSVSWFPRVWIRTGRECFWVNRDTLFVGIVRCPLASVYCLGKLSVDADCFPYELLYYTIKNLSSIFLSIINRAWPGDARRMHRETGCATGSDRDSPERDRAR